MKKFMKAVTAASGDESKLALMLDSISDDFDYVISGLEKLDRSGAEASNNGLIIAERLNDAIQAAIESIAESI